MILDSELQGQTAMLLKKAKLKSKSLLSRLGGVSAFGFGVSFKPPETDRTVVRELLTFLEDRRALFVAAIWEQPEHVVHSVQQMRTELTNALKRLGEGSPAAAACRLMRAACRDFVSQADTMKLQNMDRHFSEGWQGETFLIALGALRATFGQQIAVLSHLYEIGLEEHLASILPPIADGDGK
ncbi:MAG: hypothetical protein Q8L22_15455 [Reyranella sp.]|nr:hypothetical protein [Reyranella sp.]